MSYFVFVDNSNVWIEGKFASAVAKSLYKDAAEGDTFVLVMGDKDFQPALEAIREENCKSVVAFWDNAAAELVSEADEFINLTPLIKSITH